MRTYSDTIPGSERNYDWPVRFEKSEGFVRIAQDADNGPETILLCPRQVKALVAFVAPRKRR
jgi:hypothetical protein